MAPFAQIQSSQRHSTCPSVETRAFRLGVLMGSSILALSFLLGLSGCRFGNNVITPEDPYASDPSGYYKAGVENLEFCVDTASSTCAPASVSLLPDLARAVYTNPVIVLLEDAQTGAGYIAASDRSGNAFPVLIGSDNETLAYSGATSAEILWDDPNCTTQLYLEQAGRLVTSSPNRGTELLGLPLSGDVELSVRVIQSIDGTCADSLTAMKDCYLDANTCGGSTGSENLLIQELAQDYLGKHVQSGALDLNASDFTQIRSLSYEINYK